jgi:hypothetical protein
MGMTGQQAWDMLAALPAWQLTEVPRPDRDQPAAGAADSEASLRVQALASAYGTGEAVAVAWLRDRPGGEIRVLTAGLGLAGGQDGRDTVLTLPAGARGVRLPNGGAARVLAELPCWTRIGGVTDVLLAGDLRGEQDQLVPPSLEKGLLSAWLDAFAWLVLAEPVPDKTINDLAADASYKQLTAQGFSSPRSQLAARRAGARHEELREAVTSGLWRVHLLAAGRTPEAAARVARLVSTSADLRGLPYALSPRDMSGSLPEALLAAVAARPSPTRQPQPGPQRHDPPARSAWDTPMDAQWQSPGTGQQWPSEGYAPDPATAARLADDERDTPVAESPFTASTRLLAALARPPAREVPGLRFTLRPDFDVTPETNDGPGVAAGRVLDGNRVPAGVLTLPLASLNRHVFVTGATGSGKSMTTRNLLEQATAAGIPWLVIEPAKAEYRLMAARLPGTPVIRIRPGDLDVAPAGINPLEPAAGQDGTRFPLQTHADLLRALFLAAFQADEPFPQVLAAALTRAYEQAGWDLVTGQPAAPGVQPAYPTLEDLQATAITVVNEIGYGRDVADNVRGFVTVRIGSLRHGTTGRFLAGGHPLDFTKLLDSNVVFEIEDAGDDRDKAFLMGAVLLRLTEYLRLRQHAGPPGAARLRHLTVIEEAHRLLRQPPPGAGNGPAAQAVEMYADLLAEVRAYGEGLIIADQIPSKLISDVIKNTAVKLVHRLPAADDRAAVGATMNLQEDQSAYLVTLTPGEAAVFTDGMDYPLLARIPDGTARESVPAATATPEAVITARSLSCDPLCRQQPCTLAQIRAAQLAADHDPAIAVWAELAVLGTVTGWPAPVPGPALTSRLVDLPERLLGCTLSHAVDAAVSARAAALRGQIDPAALAAHVTGMLRDFAADGHPYPPQSPRWLVAGCRWNLIRAGLAARISETGPDAPPHPDTSAWADQYARKVPGDTCGEQLAAVLAWKNDAWAQLAPAERRTLEFGARAPSAIEKAAGARAGTPQLRPKLAAMLAGAFTDGNWALPWLAPRRPRTAPRNGSR